MKGLKDWELVQRVWVFIQYKSRISAEKAKELRKRTIFGRKQNQNNKGSMALWYWGI